MSKRKPAGKPAAPPPSYLDLVKAGDPAAVADWEARRARTWERFKGPMAGAQAGLRHALAELNRPVAPAPPVALPPAQLVKMLAEAVNQAVPTHSPPGPPPEAIAALRQLARRKLTKGMKELVELLIGNDFEAELAALGTALDWPNPAKTLTGMMKGSKHSPGINKRLHKVRWQLCRNVSGGLVFLEPLDDPKPT